MYFPSPLAVGIASLLLVSTQATRAGMEIAPPPVADGGSSKKIVEPPVESCVVSGSFTLAYEGSEHLNTGYLDSLTPLWRPGNGMLFLDTKSAIDDESRYSSSYGLGFRYLFPQPQIIAGINAFYDSIHSPYGNDFNQLGVGAEVLTKWVDARFNYYLPDGNLYEVGRSSSVSTSSDVGPVFLNGPLLQQRITTTQRIRTLSFAEGAMEGWDAELGFLIPGLDRFMQVRAFAGAYHFDNPVGPNFTGVKARLEARLLRGVTADVAYWEDAYLNGGQWTAGLRVNLPFSLGNVFRGRNPFEGFAEQFQSGAQDEFCKRMGESIMRSPARTTIAGWDPQGHVNGAHDGKGSTLDIKTTTQTQTLGRITGFVPANVSGTTASGTFSGGLLTVATSTGGALTISTSNSGFLSGGGATFSGGTLSLFSGAATTTVAGGSTILNFASAPTSAASIAITGGALTLSSSTIASQATNGVLATNGLIFQGVTTLNVVPGNNLTLSGLNTNTFTGSTLTINPGSIGNIVFNSTNFTNGTINFPPATTGRNFTYDGQSYTVPPGGGTLIVTNGVVTGGTLF